MFCCEIRLSLRGTDGFCSGERTIQLPFMPFVGLEIAELDEGNPSTCPAMIVVERIEWWPTDEVFLLEASDREDIPEQHHSMANTIDEMKSWWGSEWEWDEVMPCMPSKEFQRIMNELDQRHTKNVAGMETYQVQTNDVLREPQEPKENQ